jgi:hypothetical protein
MTSGKQEMLTVMRHALGSIDLSDAKDEVEMSDQERKDYCAAIFAVMPRLEKDLKRFMYTQLRFTMQNATDWEQVMFGRGCFDAMGMLLDHWQQASDEHINRSNGEDFNKHAVIAEM